MEQVMGMKVEGFLRVLCTVLSSAAALIVALDRESKEIFFKERKATFKYLHSLWHLVIICSAAAGYHLLQSCRCFVFAWALRSNPCSGSKLFAWVSFLLDQAVTYATFAAASAAAQDAMIGIFAVRALQWGKICNTYTGFCVLLVVGGVCAFLATFSMAVVASLSAYHLFRLYPSPASRIKN
ncbi:CASP-like protein 2C1 [Iris pallida]|uniref:CASP-like protein n=1 Tax=Iris pallida TaxID=29817 RepID=A0AAX6EJL9_IRIPA|nr:CASP-like protein 2C1 [Iris pallida]